MVMGYFIINYGIRKFFIKTIDEFNDSQTEYEIKKDTSFLIIGREVLWILWLL